ncbi:chitin synthase chs-2-like [Anguilla anguilla]|uniref:chitin synthase chs-2-like n=1 Tax=Anguilla anguilla TaxID=7936 RepID=UPI0015ABA2F4|nr:chitin synthase chs-2-like [Anguilla anguilla]
MYDKEETRHRPREFWDRAQEVPVIQDEQKPRKFISFIHFITCTFVGLMAFALAFFSKSSLLLLITASNTASKAVSTKPYALLFLACCTVAPNVLALIKSIWKMTFKDSKTPLKLTILWVFCIETLVAFGTMVLIIVAMPHFDIITNVMILNSVGILSAVLQLAVNLVTRARNKILFITSITAFILITAGYVLFVLFYILEATNSKDKSTELIKYIGLAIAGGILVSLNWWENYSSLLQTNFLGNLVKDIKRCRNIINIIASVVRIGVTAIVLGAYVKLQGLEWSSVLTISQDSRTVVLSLFAIQVLSSALCHWFVVVACKMHAVRRSFVIPMWLASPAVLLAFVLSFGIPFHSLAQQHTPGSYTFALYCQNFISVNNSDVIAFKQLASDVTYSLCAQNTFLNGDTKGWALLGSSVLSWWLGLFLSTIYIWFHPYQRIERTKDLFVRRLYEGAFIDQSMLLNARFDIPQRKRQTKENEPVTVFLCATMWHETYSEMMTILISLFRLDKFRPRRNSYRDVRFEYHIFFDDAFLDKKGSKHRHVNDYAEMLVEVIQEVYMIFSNEAPSTFRESRLDSEHKIIKTPYGGRLQYTLPHGNILNIHFKDKQLIRHKKRWSQIMYLYFLLGWKLNRKYILMFQNGEEKNILEEQLKKEKENTYILALDGDTDFQPSAVMLLVDRLRLYPEVGAACGRIHPTGTGPMVWYQKFEYAVGHWMQKAAEHVFGCVLCSPGCFSLFRAAALMDDNVMKRYTTVATEARHYVQYDQGEDRWLCTLMLQQGWRVEYNAASDSYTNAPQEFKEFYNQRRRWGPSTLANTVDLLATGTLTAQKNKSISRLYILYQIVNMASSILGPATVCLLIAGSFKFVFNMSSNASLILAIIPPAIYLFLCFKLKSDTQITIAAVMSVFYAFLMSATLLSIIGELVIQKTFLTPSGIFFIGIVLLYLTTALLHPKECHLVVYGVVYALTIPSGYLLLAIYSIVNMNNVSWGTRETAGPGKDGPDPKDQKNVKFEKKCKCCCWNVQFQVHGDEKVVVSPGPTEAPITTEPTIENHPDQEEWKVARREEESSEICWITRLRQKSSELVLEEDTLDHDEEQFWIQLQEQYLKPLYEDKKKQMQIADDLRDLRNKAAFVIFICNALWLVVTFFLQEIGAAVSIEIPKTLPNGTIVPRDKIYIDPIGFMFLLSFASLLVIQFFGMIWHRIQTLIHFIAYSGTQAKPVNIENKWLLEEINDMNFL